LPHEGQACAPALFVSVPPAASIRGAMLCYGAFADTHACGRTREAPTADRSMIRITNPRDFWAGVLFVALGVGTIVIGSRYALGTAARMGPGYFPRILGILLIVLGGIIAIRATRTAGPPVPHFHWRPLVIVLGSVVLFGAIVRFAGVALSTVILIVTASAASREFRPRESLLAGLVLAALAVSVFVIGLKLQLPIWPGQD